MKDKTLIVACIDPGIANTGLGVVRFDGKTPTILHAVTVHSEPTSKGNNTRQRTQDSWRRALSIAAQCVEHIDPYKPDLVGIELFSDQGAERKKFAGRGDTAMLIGALVHEFDRRLHVLCPLDSTVVASQHGAMREQVEWWKQGKTTGIAGEELMVKRTSVHAREAVAHALFLGRTYDLLGQEGVYAL